jgi:hypothetical protein
MAAQIKTISVLLTEFQVPVKLHELIEQCVERGIWGETPEEVMLNFVRTRVEYLIKNKLIEIPPQEARP